MGKGLRNPPFKLSGSQMRNEPGQWPQTSGLSPGPFSPPPRYEVQIPSQPLQAKKQVGPCRTGPSSKLFRLPSPRDPGVCSHGPLCAAAGRGLHGCVTAALNRSDLKSPEWAVACIHQNFQPKNNVPTASGGRACPPGLLEAGEGVYPHPHLLPPQVWRGTSLTTRRCHLRSTSSSSTTCGTTCTSLCWSV